MKKMIRLFGLICLVSSTFIGCSGENSPQVQDTVHEQETVKELEENREDNQEPNVQQLEEEQDSKSDDQKEVPTIQEISRDEWIGKNIVKMVKKNFDVSIEFAKVYIKEKYKDYNVSIQDIEPENRYNVWGLSDVLEGAKVKCSITFTTKVPVETLEQSADKCYKEEIIVMMVKKGGEIYLSGYLHTEDYDATDQQEFLFTYFKQDKRFEEDIKDDPTIIFTDINISDIAGDLRILEKVMVTDDRLAVICKENTENINTNTKEMIVKLHDITEKKIQTITIENCNFSSVTNVSVKDNKLIVGVKERHVVDSDEGIYSYSKKNVVVNMNGDISIEKLSSEDERLYSPNNQSYVYTNRASIYYNDGVTNSSQLLLKGIESDDTNVDCYYPYEWIDEDRFVYGRGGYEWSNGCGIYIINEEKNYALADASFWPIAVRDSKLFIEESDMYGILYSLGIIDLNDNYKTSWILSDDIVKSGFIINQVNISSDGSMMAFLTNSPKTNTDELIFWSTREGKIIKTYKFENTIINPTHVSFINKNNLLIHSSRMRKRDEYLRIIKLDNLYDKDIQKKDTYQYEAHTKELDINNYREDEQLLSPNRLLTTINDYTVTNSVEVTSHDFIDQEMKDFPIKKVNSDDLKEEVISLERMDNDLFDNYSNILMPRLVKDGILFLVQDLIDSKVCYLMKYQFSDNSIQPMYTIDGSNYERFNLEEGFYSVNVKTTDNCIIYRWYNDALVYDIENNIISSHIRYSEQITDDVFDISSDGQLIAFINQERSLIVSDLYMKKPKIIMKGYLAPNDELGSSIPRYPHFSITNPHALTFRLQGYEWSYGDMLYNVIDETIIKLPQMKNEETSKEWLGSELIMGLGMYESDAYSFINQQNEYITIDKELEVKREHVDYGLSNNVMGTPLYDKDMKLIFLDIINKRLTKIENIHLNEDYVSISSDGQYLITRTNGGSNFELSKIVGK